MRVVAEITKQKRQSRAAANNVYQKKDNRQETVGAAAGRLKTLPKGTTGTPISHILQRKPFIIQMHKGQDQFDETIDAMIIYKVVLKSDDSVVYIGQTEESRGIDARFTEHLRTQLNWGDSAHKIKRIEAGDWTKFETDGAEQYWIDLFGGKDELDNVKNQVSRSRFETIMEDQKKYGNSFFRRTRNRFPSGWNPVN